MLEKLQNILSYLIDECNQSTVMLAHEIDAIKDFIQLERLTNPDRFTVEYEQTGDPDNCVLFHSYFFLLWKPISGR
jgi:LytS/YehU family sensor histidine kinase